MNSSKRHVKVEWQSSELPFLVRSKAKFPVVVDKISCMTNRIHGSARGDDEKTSQHAV